MAWTRQDLIIFRSRMIYLGFAFAGYKSSWILPTSGPNFIKKIKIKMSPQLKFCVTSQGRSMCFRLKRKKESKSRRGSSHHTIVPNWF